MPGMPNNREGPQAKEPSKCLNTRSYGEKLAKEAFWSPATRGLKKDSARALTPVVEAARVLGTLGTARGPASQASAPPSRPSHWGRAATGKKKKCLVSIRAGSLRSCPALWDPEDCGLPGSSVREGGSPGKNTGGYCPKSGAARTPETQAAAPPPC